MFGMSSVGAGQVSANQFLLSAVSAKLSELDPTLDRDAALKQSSAMVCGTVKASAADIGDVLTKTGLETATIGSGITGVAAGVITAGVLMSAPTVGAIGVAAAVAASGVAMAYSGLRKISSGQSAFFYANECRSKPSGIARVASMISAGSYASSLGTVVALSAGAFLNTVAMLGSGLSAGGVAVATAVAATGAVVAVKGYKAVKKGADILFNSTSRTEAVETLPRYLPERPDIAGEATRRMAPVLGKSPAHTYG